jgi:hypothetical protein
MEASRADWGMLQQRCRGVAVSADGSTRDRSVN